MPTKSDNLYAKPYAIPVETAQRWVANWIEADPGDKPVDPKDMRAFLVHRADFVELLAQDDTEYIRMYLGRKEDPKTGELHPCLVLTSAARNGDVHPEAPNPDHVIDLVGEVVIDSGGQTRVEDYEVFDFSSGCPPHCDPESPLFIGEADERCT